MKTYFLLLLALLCLPLSAFANLNWANKQTKLIQLTGSFHINKDIGFLNTVENGAMKLTGKRFYLYYFLNDQIELTVSYKNRSCRYFIATDYDGKRYLTTILGRKGRGMDCLPLKQTTSNPKLIVQLK
jgi:hypothetical protein